VKGKVNLKGKVAFVSQTTWLRNDTLRNNVLFESEFEEERYNRAIKLSQLEEDIEILSEGDNSLIG
jgi:ABC-type multidrug transport system fused ATPase/permease subunit